MLKDGLYPVHSKFNRVWNFRHSNYLVSVVAEQVGPGPLNLVADALDHASPESLKVRGEVISINSAVVDSRHALVYDSSMEFGRDRFVPQPCLEIFQRTLLESQPEAGLGFLLGGPLAQGRESSFRRAFQDRLRTGVALIFEGRAIEGVCKIRGCGYGLTPSGDDFIAGVLFGLNLVGVTRGESDRSTIDAIHEAARGESLFSNTMLRLAREGRPFGLLRSVLESLLDSGVNEAEIIVRSQKLFEVGETSGSDLATGLLMTLMGGEIRCS